MSHLLIVKRLELYMDLALYKINILLLLLCTIMTLQYYKHDDQVASFTLRNGVGANI